MEGLLKVGLRALIKTLEEREQKPESQPESQPAPEPEPQPEPEPEAKIDDEAEATDLSAAADALGDTLPNGFPYNTNAVESYPFLPLTQAPTNTVFANMSDTELKKNMVKSTVGLYELTKSQKSLLDENNRRYNVAAAAKAAAEKAAAEKAAAEKANAIADDDDANEMDKELLADDDDDNDDDNDDEEMEKEMDKEMDKELFNDDGFGGDGFDK